jgi:hypothetical protein
VWQDLNTNLVAYPTDENGYMIAATIPFNISHSTFSHLFMIYPLKTLTDWNNNEQRNLAITSFSHWISMREGLTGYKYVLFFINVTRIFKSWCFNNGYFGWFEGFCMEVVNICKYSKN